MKILGILILAVAIVLSVYFGVSIAKDIARRVKSKKENNKKE